MKVKTLVITKTLQEANPAELDQSISEWLKGDLTTENMPVFDEIESEVQYAPQLGNGHGQHCAMIKVYGTWNDTDITKHAPEAEPKKEGE